MITFERDGTQVKMILKTGLKVPKPNHLWWWECGKDNEEYALLLAAHLQKRFADLVAVAHKTAYDEGWAAAKRHNGAKATSFSRTLSEEQDEAQRCW